jgi:signal transduction histidine kinase
LSQGPEYNNNNLTKPGTFQGVAVTALLINSLGQLLKSQLFPDLISDIGLLDNNGIILYADNPSYIGKDIFGKESQSIMASAFHSTSDSINKIVKSSIQSGSCDPTDVKSEDRVNTLACAPVNVNGKHFLTLFIITPHNLAANVSTAIDEQRNFSILIIVTIAAVATGIAFIILKWNRRLQSIVNSRTQELSKSNESLIESNESLIESNKKLDSTNKQLELHDKMQKEFINVAAHELRTPIQPILGLSQVLRSKIKDNEQHVLVDVISRNAKRLQHLTEDILDVTRIESQLLQLNKEKFNLNEVIMSVLADYESLIKRIKDVKVSFISKGDFLVEADKGRLNQVISNLLDNAIKFTQKGSIAISSERKDDNVIVSIKDTGIGIDHELMPRLFSKFASKSFTGTGLGLFISKSIIEAHGGRIWAENNSDGKGATFTFSLPLVTKIQRQNI